MDFIAKMKLEIFLAKSKDELKAMATEANVDILGLEKKSQIQGKLLHHFCTEEENTHNVESGATAKLPDEDMRAVLDSTRLMNLIPKFDENQVGEFFSQFERIAFSFGWSKRIWNILIQSQLSGPAMEVYSALPPSLLHDYDYLKKNILQVYSRTPEFYRSQFRQRCKPDSISFVEFQRQKEKQFTQWYTASHVNNFDSLKDLILVENLKETLSPEMRLFVEERMDRITTPMQLATICDEYDLVHKAHSVETKGIKSTDMLQTGHALPGGSGATSEFFCSSLPPEHSHEYRPRLPYQNAGRLSQNFQIRPPEHSHGYTPRLRYQNARRGSRNFQIRPQLVKKHT